MDIISFAKASAVGGDIQLKTVNGNSLKGTGNIAITTYQAFPEDWLTYTESNKTTKQFCDVIDADESAVIGMGYFGGAKFSDKPAGLSNFDIVVEILAGPVRNGAPTKAIHLIGTSSTVNPYRWEYTYWSHGSVSGWRGVESASNKVTSLSANSTDAEYPSAKCVYDALPKMYRHNISVNGHVISVLLPFSDTVDNHHSSLAAGVVGTFVDTPTGLLTGLGYIYWNVDEWQIYDVSNTEIASKATCADTITALA